MEHRKPSSVFFPALAFALTIAAPALAGNWPAWRGPAGDGVSPDPNPPTAWGETENITWSAELKGKGSSTPAVWGDTIFLTAQTEDEQEWVLALDRGTGKQLWEQPGGKGMTRVRNGANMASPSPATDGERVVASFGTGDVLCFDFSGKPLWKYNLQAENGKFTIWWGYSSSPLIEGDTVYVAVINEGPSYLIALDKKTGAVKWKTERTTEAKSEPCDSYATPIAYTAKGRREIFLSGALWATAYDPAKGDLLWKANIGGDRSILSPTAADGFVYVVAGKREKFHAIEAGGTGDVTATAIKWEREKSMPDVPSPLVVGPNVYVIDDKGVVQCFRRADGETLYQERLASGDYKASPVLAGGKIYATAVSGETTLIEPGDTFKKGAVNKIGEEAAMASLAFSEGQIFQRGVTKLHCIGKRAK